MSSASPPAVEEVQQVLCQNKDNLCDSTSIDPLLWKEFGENICSICKRKTSDFDLISKGEVRSAFLIPEDTIKMMKYMEKSNPHNSHWTPMHLYLRKHAKEFAIKRFGSLAAMEFEKHKREQKKFETDFIKTDSIIREQTLEYKQSLTKANQSIPKSTESTIGQKRSAIDECKATHKVTKHKKTLKSLIECLRGNDT
mmetsp:Transcript_4890/g.6747  ORF Transcript_4890/g.6747 Transcript_4890/m.6747 type:complete len:197 (-) Transcript_4890:30-620(-)